MIQSDSVTDYLWILNMIITRIYFSVFSSFATMSKYYGYNQGFKQCMLN